MQSLSPAARVVNAAPTQADFEAADRLAWLADSPDNSPEDYPGPGWFRDEPRPTRRGMLGLMAAAAFAPIPPAAPDAIPAELSASCRIFGDPVDLVVLPPGRPAPPAPPGAWQGRLPLQGGWELLIVYPEWPATPVAE